jgi:hypothetical protein
MLLRVITPDPSRLAKRKISRAGSDYTKLIPFLKETPGIVSGVSARRR